MKYKYIVILIVLTYTIQIALAALPNITINDPTPLNNSINTTGIVSINVTASDMDGDNMTAFLDWNSSLVGWWRMNDIAGGTLVEDHSGYGNNGSIINIVNVSGKFGTAIDFNGAGDYVNVESNNNLDTAGDITVEMWFNADTWFSNNYMIRKNTESQYNYQIIQESSSSSLFFYSYNGSHQYAHISRPPTGSWHHVVGIRNGSTLSIYLDGVKGVDGYVTSVDNTTGSLYIGGLSYDYYFDGAIDEVRIHNRSLSAEEINASYNAGLNSLISTFSNLSNGNYNYTAYVQDSTGEVNSTTKQYITVDFNIPTTPEISFPANNTRQWNNAINFTWNASIDGDSGDTILYNYSKARDPNFTVAQNGSVTSDLFSGIMPSLVHGARYYLKVRSYDGHQYSPWSNIIEYIENSKPSYTNITLTNTSVPTLDATFEMVDSEGDAVTNYTRWYKNGTLQPLLNDSIIIPGDNLSAGQIWYFEVYGNDGYENSTPKQSNNVSI